MKREEKKMLKENEKALELIIKNDSKLYGYKTVSGFIYKVIDDFVFTILVGIKYVNKNISVNISYKPIILDKIFWEVFNMAEERKPFSYHVNGVFTAKTVTITEFELEYNNKDDAKIKFKEIINCSNNIIEQYKKNNDINTFYEYIKNNENQYLNIILIDIIKNDYKSALDKINDCMKNHKNGGFLNENYKTIIELAKEYCDKKIQ